MGWDHSAGDVIVRVAGEIDLSSVIELEVGLHQACRQAEPGRKLIVDMGGVTFLGLAGMHALDAARETCLRSGVVFLIAAVQPAVTRPIRLVGAACRLSLLPDSRPLSGG